MVAWPVAMTYVTPLAVDTVASATPLAQMAAGEAAPSVMDMFRKYGRRFWARRALAILIGGLVLIIARVISGASL